MPLIVNATANPSTKLTKKQYAFAQEYVRTGNATQSALASYSTTVPRTACAIGSENLTKPLIKQELLRISERNGLGLDDSFHILNSKVRKERGINALNLWFDVVGAKAPIKHESTERKEISISLSAEQIEKLAAVTVKIEALNKKMLLDPYSQGEVIDCQVVQVVRELGSQVEQTESGGRVGGGEGERVIPAGTNFGK